MKVFYTKSYISRIRLYGVACLAVYEDWAQVHYMDPGTRNLIRDLRVGLGLG